MKKSYNDILAQADRVVKTAQSIGKYCDNAKRVVDTQFIYQVARRAMTQRGIPVFCADKDEKRDIVYREPIQVQEQAQIVEPPKIVAAPAKTPTEQVEERVTWDEWLSADEAHRKMLQDLCRQDFIKKMLAELLTDMGICQLEGWDVLEYPRMLKHEIERILPKEPIQLKLFNN